MSDRVLLALAVAVLLALGAAGYGVHMECVAGTCGPVMAPTGASE